MTCTVKGCLQCQPERDEAAAYETLKKVFGLLQDQFDELKELTKGMSTRAQIIKAMDNIVLDEQSLCYICDKFIDGVCTAETTSEIECHSTGFELRK